MNIFFSFNEGDPIVTSVDIASIDYKTPEYTYVMYVQYSKTMTSRLLCFYPAKLIFSLPIC